MTRVGCVPYANAKPLVWWFEHLEDASPVQVVYDVPSRLPALLQSGQADAVLASSYDALATPGRRVAGGICIASEGPVRSVRLFSKVPFPQIRSLALDQSSMTSNALARLLLAEVYGSMPGTNHSSPDLAEMLSGADAAVLIGDRGMAAQSEGLYVLDLGEAWTQWTGLPFVWAMWIGGAALDTELVGWLETAMLESGFSVRSGRAADRKEGLVAEFAAEAGWPEERMAAYLTDCIRFDMGEREWAGLGEFQSRLEAQGDAAARFLPEVVTSPQPDPNLAPPVYSAGTGM